MAGLGSAPGLVTLTASSIAASLQADSAGHLPEAQLHKDRVSGVQTGAGVAAVPTHDKTWISRTQTFQSCRQLTGTPRGVFQNAPCPQTGQHEGSSGAGSRQGLDLAPLNSQAWLFVGPTALGPQTQEPRAGRAWAEALRAESLRKHSFLGC